MLVLTICVNSCGNIRNTGEPFIKVQKTTRYALVEVSCPPDMKVFKDAIIIQM